MYTKHKWNSERYYNFKYVQYLPKNYDGTKKYPLVLYLHGTGQRGDNVEDVTKHGYMRYVREENKEFPFIIISPQCPSEKYWGCYTESLIAFLDYICEDLFVDESKIYLTGNSMGGTGTWMLAMAAPEKFAAIAPICASGICWNAEPLKEIPIYMYHGDCDEVVPIYESMTMLKNVNKIGGNAKLKICYGVGHNAWDYAYTDNELIEWMLGLSK